MFTIEKNDENSQNQSKKCGKVQDNALSCSGAVPNNNTKQ